MGVSRSPGRPAWQAALVVFVFLLATVDERSFGLVTDGHQMLSAAFALVHDGEIGTQGDRSPALARDAGDPVSRYGMGQSFLEAVPLLAARGLWAVRPGTPTNPLFVLVPIAGLAAAAWGAARAAIAFGASPMVSLLCGLALPLATPLLGYGASDLSEPLQAAAISLLLAAAAVLRLEEKTSRLWEVAAGFAAGVAILAKSFLVAVVGPLALVAAIRPGAGSVLRRVRWRVVAAGGVVGAVWAFFELARFQTLFGGYAAESFSHPLVDGLLRLTVYPNKGLLWYAPLVLLAPAGIAALWKRDRLLATAITAALVSVLLLVARWWAWDGEIGWGPRLLVPVLPLVIAAGAAAVATGGRRRRLVALALFVLGIAVNALTVVVPFQAVYLIAYGAGTPSVGPGTPQVPDDARRREASHRLATTPSWSPIRIQVRLLLEKLRGGDVAARLRAGALADLDPPLVPEGEVPYLAATPLTWTFWGRSWVRPLPGLVDPYRQALIDQSIRAMDLRRWEKAWRHASLLVRAEGVSPEPFDVAVAADAALKLGRAGEADRLLALVPGSCLPAVAFVRAERGMDVSCVPEAMRGRFLASVVEAQRRGLPVTGWARLAAGR